MQTVTIPMVVFPAHVNVVTLEMELTALVRILLVCQEFVSNGIYTTDVDECLETESMCGMNAKCTDTEGSYMCTCSGGFTGNGSNCSSETSAGYQRSQSINF